MIDVPQRTITTSEMYLPDRSPPGRAPRAWSPDGAELVYSELQGICSGARSGVEGGRTRPTDDRLPAVRLSKPELVARPHAAFIPSMHLVPRRRTTLELRILDPIRPTADRRRLRSSETAPRYLVGPALVPRTAGARIRPTPPVLSSPPRIRAVVWLARLHYVSGSGRRVAPTGAPGQDHRRRATAGLPRILLLAQSFDPLPHPALRSHRRDASSSSSLQPGRRSRRPGGHLAECPRAPGAATARRSAYERENYTGNARPTRARDGRRVVYSSYLRGRQRQSALARLPGGRGDHAVELTLSVTGRDHTRQRWSSSTDGAISRS
jgi:hypothetical protein